MATASSSRCANSRFRPSPEDRKKIPCNFFLRGACKFADNCRYFHDKSLLSKNSDVIQDEKPPLQVSVRPHENNWADAVEFVPGAAYQPRDSYSYSQTVQTYNDEPDYDNQIPDATANLCPYNVLGNCRYKDECIMLHGALCEMCGLYILHPTDVQEQRKHKQECLTIHEKDMEESFKLAKNQDISCGICMEKVIEKAEEKDRKFGILENCNHAFCLSCIRKWRQAKSFKSSVVKSCPECRVTSSFITPSEYFVEDKDEKEALIKGYKDHLASKHCMYFKKGKARCPFGVKCFYKHQYEDGTLQDRTKPDKFVRNRNGDWEDITAHLWDFFGDRDDDFEVDIEETLEWLDLLNSYGSDIDDNYFSDGGPDWFPDTDSDSDFYIF